MARRQTADTAVAEQDEKDFEYPVTIEDAGPGAKKVSIEIPRDRIEKVMEQQFKELRQQAAIPGFRPGHAPQKLIEKRFQSEIKDQVRRQLISESYQQAVEKNKLQVIGEPEFDDPEKIELPEEGNLSYSFQVEVQPEFALPLMGELKVRRPKVNITDDNVEQAMNNLREQQGTLIPVEDRGVEEKDYLTADVHVKVDGEVIAHQHDAQLVARPGRVAGVQVDDLDKQLEGMKVGEKRVIKVTGPESHPSEKMRGKEAEVEVDLKDVKRLELAEVTPEFLAELGFENESELRDALRQQMEEKIRYDVQQAMREQVNKFLLDNVQLDLPKKLSDRQAERVVSRRAIDLMMRGVPREQVEASVERLRHGAQDEAVRELKLFFILQKIANDMAVDVDEAELNGRIAMLAAQRGRRPEKMKQEMSKDGSLMSLYVQMREQKAIDRILAQAQVEEVEVSEANQAAGGEAAASDAT
jgi:trigger factor